MTAWVVPETKMGRLLAGDLEGDHAGRRGPQWQVDVSTIIGIR
jgi:hypothetical protein